MKLFLDDWRRAPEGEGYKEADNYADFLALLDKYRDCLEEVSLDFDLGWGSAHNGLDALRYMDKHDIRPAHINVHSTHYIGREKMLVYAKANFPDSIVTGRSAGW